MSTEPQGVPRLLPDHPNLRHLKDEAKDLLRTGGADIDHGCAIPDRASLWVYELAEAQGSRRIVRGVRAA